MTIPFLAACLGWVATTCLLVVVFLRALREKDTTQAQERALHRVELEGLLTRQEGLLSAHREEVSALNQSHREEIAALNQARIEEVANLCQRIQAPEQAVVSHIAENAPPDPAPVDLEDDLALIESYEQRLGNFAAELGSP